MKRDEGGCGWPKTPAADPFPGVGAAGPPAAARPRGSGRSYAATGRGAMAPEGP